MTGFWVVFVVLTVLGALPWWWTGEADSIGGGLFVSALINTLIALVVWMTVTGFMDHTPHLERTDLASLGDSTETYGQFSFLDAGFVDSKLKYTYYERVGDGRYQGGSVDAANVTIIEDAKPGEAYYLSNTGCSYEGLELWVPCYESDERGMTEIHVPKGSVIQRIKLDTE